MITILRFILFFLLAPAFAIVVQADDFRIVNTGCQVELVILDGTGGEICNYDSSGALLQQRKSIDGEDGRNGHQELETSGATEPLFSFLSEFVATNNVDDYLRLADNLDVSTTRNSAVFYSGRGNRELAEAFATQNGRTTLEMTAGGRYLDDLQLFGANSPLTPAEATQVWSRLSQRFANEASGNAVGFVNGARAEGIFNTIEYPALRANPNITNVITGGN